MGKVRGIKSLAVIVVLSLTVLSFGISDYDYICVESNFRLTRSGHGVFLSDKIVYTHLKQISVGAEPTDIHFVKFNPSEGEIQMAIQMDDKTKGRTYTFDRQHGIVRLINPENGKEIIDHDLAFDIRVLPQEHADRFVEQNGNDLEVIAILGNGNLAWNRYFVGYINGELIKTRDEPVFERCKNGFLYSSLVIWENGRVSVEDLKYEEDENKDVRVIKVNITQDGVTEEDITDKIQSATYGQRLIREGNKVAPTEIYKEYDDLRHILKLPVVISDKTMLSGGIYFGMYQLFENDKIKVKESLEGESIALDRLLDYENMELSDEKINSLRNSLKELGYVQANSLDDVESIGQFYITSDRVRIYLNENDLRKALNYIGYTEVKSSKTVKERGDYRIGEEKVNIVLKLGVYPHHIEAVTESGEVISLTVLGKSGFKGGTIRGITDWLKNCPEFQEDSIQNAVLLDNGGDPMIWTPEGFLAKPSTSREGRVQSVILLFK